MRSSQSQLLTIYTLDTESYPSTFSNHKYQYAQTNKWYALNNLPSGSKDPWTHSEKMTDKPLYPSSLAAGFWSVSNNAFNKSWSLSQSRLFNVSQSSLARGIRPVISWIQHINRTVSTWHMINLYWYNEFPFSALTSISELSHACTQNHTLAW